MDITDWRVSSYSYNGNSCLEAGNWRTSTFSVGNGACLEAGTCGHGVAIRDSVDRSGPVLTFSAAAWERFAGRVKADAGVVRLRS